MPDWLSGLLHPDLASLSAGTLYLVVWSLVLVESGVLIGFFLPGDTVLFTAGLLAAGAGSDVSVALLSGGTAVAATAGNGLGYWTGRRLGRPWLERRPARVRRHLARADAFYARFGVFALVLARFVPWARTFVPVLAGASRMRYRSFALATLGGALVWGSGLVVLGYLAHSVPWLRTVALVVAGTAVALSFLVPTAAAVRTRIRSRAARDQRGAPR